MKIIALEIENFRGIRLLQWLLPAENIICLIGSGDSGKSTILAALECLFSPRWNHTFYDSDFNNADVTQSIKIEAVLGNLPSEFCSERKYGPHLRGWNQASRQLIDEPEDKNELVLSVRLLVDNSLEPRWEVVTDRNPQGIEFRSSDRAKVGITAIGSYSDRQFSWGRGTTLTRITKLDDVRGSLVEASRLARDSVEAARSETFKGFDSTANAAETLARELGVPVYERYQAGLDIATIDINTGGLALHDAGVPLRRLGLGSKRMLLCGLQQEELAASHITTIDEIEYGLEPHRIARLIKRFNSHKDGQYFITTHSPTVLRELSVEQIHIVHRSNEKLAICCAGGPFGNTGEYQGKLRDHADAFLARKVIVCEGATEVGFLRGFDNYLLEKYGTSFSFYGVALVDARGASKVQAVAMTFKNLGYDTHVVADGDAPEHFSCDDAECLRAAGVPVLVWPDDRSIEEFVIDTLSWKGVLDSLILAEEFGNSIHDSVSARTDFALDRDHQQWSDDPVLRKAIGETAKKCNWFKRISLAEEWFERINTSIFSPERDSKAIATKLDQIVEWIKDVE